MSPKMESPQPRELTPMEWTCQELDRLCQQPTSIEDTGLKAVIDDKTFQEIADCLRDIDNIAASERPRTYAVLSMMKPQRRDLMPLFAAFGLSDNSLPYLDRRSLPSYLKTDPEASRQFLELQSHVISPACQMENSEDCRHWNIPSGDLYFRSLEKLGRGGEASVDRVQSLSSKEFYARRRIRRRRDLHRDNQILQDFHKELKIMKRLDHIHLVKIFASYTDPQFVAILMKPVASGNLKEYLQTRGAALQSSVSERSQFRSYYGCLTRALAYLHESNIRHKDIKPSNILIEKGEIYITDFGSATEFDDEKSMTKGTVKGRTVRYQSPEVFRGATRGRSSDIWSLGVTFLEMTTILRGQTLETMQDFFQKSGTKQDYVFENKQGAIKWMEYLRKSNDYSKVDNAPMQWIRDMLSEKPGDRPDAYQLFHTIMASQDGAFCGKCCTADDSTISDASSIGSLDEDATVKPWGTVQTEEMYGSYVVHLEQKAREVKKDPMKASQHARRSPLHQRVRSIVISNLPTLSSFRLPWSYSTLHLPELNQEDSKLSEPQQISPEIVIQDQEAKISDQLIEEVVADYDQYYTNMPGAFPDFPTYESPCVTDGDYGTSIDSQIPLMSASNSGAENGDNPASCRAFEDPIPGSGLTPRLDTDPRVSTPEVEPIDMACYEGCVFNPGSRGFLTLMIAPPGSQTQTLNDLLFRPTPRLQRRSSDESLELQRQAKILLAKSDLHLDDIILDTSRTILQHEVGLDRKSSTSQLRNVKEQLDRTFIMRRSKDAMPIPPLKEIPKPTKKMALPASVNDLTDDFAQETIRAHQEGVMLHPETPPAPPDDPAPHTLPASIPTRAKTNPLRTFFDSMRSPPQAPSLTGNNLNSHNTKLPPVQRSHAKVERASVYMKKVFDDTASSVATSVMSTRTRESFKIHGLMLPMQDRSCDYLGEQTKKGKADAVRMLLSAGCNPGTKKCPRPGPIFNVVRGASSRHTKCLRALIEHGVNVNVRSRRTQKTPLLEAFEQDAWSGYVTVIYLLLGAGANPNAKDPSGDVPLLKLLSGGTHPLENHRRDALALLLSSNYKTDVKVTPLGTQNKPLHLAIRRNDSWAVGMLLDKPESVLTIEAENSEGLTPLLLAATLWSSAMTTGQLEILDYLLEKGANVHVKMLTTHRTPLHIAVSHGLVHAVEVLIIYGADVTARTREGKTAREVAEERRRSHACRDCGDCENIKRILASAGRED